MTTPSLPARLAEIASRAEDMKPQPMCSPKIGGADARAFYIQDVPFLLAAVREASEALEKITSEQDMKPAKYAKGFARETLARLEALARGER
jgi:hypothetical protein